MKVECGLYSTVGWNVPFNEICKKYSEYGFKNIGLYWNWISKKEIQSMIETCKSNNLNIEAVHLPFRDTGEIWKYNFKGMRYFMYLKKCIKIMAKNNLKTCVCHSAHHAPVIFTLIGLKRFRKIVKMCEKLNIIFCLENLRTVDHVEYLLSRINSNNLKFCLDTGHANVWCYKPLDALEKFKDKIYTVHINDNDALRDIHLVPGDGNIDWKTFIPKLYKIYDGKLMLELNNFKAPEYSYKTLDEYLNTIRERVNLLLSYINKEK